MGLMKAWREARDARMVVIDADGVRVSGYSGRDAARILQNPKTWELARAAQVARTAELRAAGR